MGRIGHGGPHPAISGLIFFLETLPMRGVRDFSWQHRQVGD